MAIFQKSKTAEKKEAQPTIRTKLLLRVDKYMDGPFAGLYRLTSIDKEGNEKIATDANTKVLILGNAHKLLMGCD